MGSRGRKKAALNEKLQERRASTSSSPVTVETLSKGFLINVFMENNSPGLLVRILEAFEELGLEVLDANVTCSDSFQLQAVGEENKGGEGIDAQVVKQAVSQAIQIWSRSNDED